MPATVAPSSLVQSATLRMNAPTTYSLAGRSSDVVALCMWISGIPPPPSEYSSSISSDPRSFPRHSWWSTRFIATTSAPLGDCRAKHRLHWQSTGRFLDWKQGNPKTKLSACMGITSISDPWTGDMCCIYWTVDSAVPLLLVWAIAWPLRSKVVTYASSSAISSWFCCLGGKKMLVVPQSMRAHTHCISPLPSLIQAWWMIWDMSGLPVPHKYWLEMRAFRLSNNTRDFKAIWCGCMLSIVTIKVSIANLPTPNSALSIVSCRARHQERPMSLSADNCWRTSVVLFGVLQPCLELLSGPAAVSYLLVRI